MRRQNCESLNFAAVWNRAMMKSILSVLLFSVIVTPSLAAESIVTLRKNIAIDVEATPLKMYRTNNEDIRRKRNYPMQPPLIPHQIRGYQIDLHANKCLYCHARSASEVSQAPMISVTHYMNREGNFLADVSPRRYFCLQCHVSQTDATPLVANDFLDIDQMLGAEKTSRR